MAKLHLNPLLITVGLLFFGCTQSDDTDTDTNLETDEPTASPPEVIFQMSASSYYNTYVNMAVNNGHYALRDRFDRLHVTWINEAGEPVVGTLGDTGDWQEQRVSPHAAGSILKNPNLVQRGDDDYVLGWLERDGDQTHLVLADGALQEPGSSSAHQWTPRLMTSIPYTGVSTEPKYLTMASAGEGALLGFTEGNPDVQGRVFGETGELAMSPLQSGLGPFVKSSDITLDAAGDFAVIVWEEDWSGMGPGKNANLLFITSTDGGKTWTAPTNILASGPTPGGDPSVYCTEDGTMYLAFQKPEQTNVGGIFAARRLPGDSHFSLIDAPGMETLGRLGSGWLAAVDGLPDRFAVSWEQTAGEYMTKWEHRVTVAFIANADKDPVVTYGPMTDSVPEDEQTYDLAANISLADDGARVDVFWVRVEGPANDATLKLMHRVDLATEGTDDIQEP